MITDVPFLSCFRGDYSGRAYPYTDDKNTVATLAKIAERRFANKEYAAGIDSLMTDELIQDMGTLFLGVVTGLEYEYSASTKDDVRAFAIVRESDARDLWIQNLRGE